MSTISQNIPTEEQQERRPRRMRQEAPRLVATWLPVLTVVPLVAAIAFGLREQLGTSRRFVEDALVESSDTSSDKVAYWYVETASLFGRFGKFPEVSSGDVEATNRLLGRMMTVRPYLNDLYYVAGDGQIAASGHPAPISRRDVSAKLQSSKVFRESVTDGFRVDSPTLDPASNRWTAFVGSGVIARSGREGHLVAVVDLVKLSQFLFKDTPGLPRKITVLDSSGRTLMRHPDPENHLGRVHPSSSLIHANAANNTVSKGRGFNGEDRIFASKRVADTALVLAVGVQEAIAMAPAIHKVRRNGVILFGGLAVSCGIYLLVRRRIISNRSEAAALAHATAEIQANAFREMRTMTESATVAELGQLSLENSETFLRMPVAAVTLTADGAIAKTNREAEKLLANAASELEGRSLESFFDKKEITARTPPDQSHLAPFHALRVVASSSKAEEMNWTITRPDGMTVGANVVISPLGEDENSRSGYVAVFRDLSFRKEAEEERRAIAKTTQERARLESLGLLAGGVAHDFNNILTGMLGCIQLAQPDVSDRPETLSLLSTAENAGKRARELCAQVLTHVRRGKEGRCLIDLHTIINDAVSLVSASTKSVKFHFSLNKDASSTTGDIVQLRQIILNLLINAAEAMGGRQGNVLLSTDRVYFRGKDFVRVRVKDDGIGMPSEVASRVFEPFFTTKESGTGIGLASTQGIMEEHGGSISVESEVGKGTTFTLMLPYSPPPFANADSGGDQKGCVLLVDDEDALRGITAHALRRHGYEVVEASSGTQALAAYNQTPEWFTAVLLDLTMPNMDGTETLATLRVSGLLSPVILMSGLDNNPALTRIPRESYDAFLKKPYTVKEIIETIETVIVQSSELQQSDHED